MAVASQDIIILCVDVRGTIHLLVKFFQRPGSSHFSKISPGIFFTIQPSEMSEVIQPFNIMAQAQSTPFIVLVAALLTNTLSYCSAENVYCVTLTAASCSSFPHNSNHVHHTL